SKKSFQQLAKEKGAVAYEKANEKVGFFYCNKLS
ncbi:L,D-transpeptidase, partial [Bacillus thuringiensis]|nr:L,D-transpeptidase [Bacillus thuringiensis]